jgi:hypothetical protein
VALADELLGRLGHQGARRKLKALVASSANGGPA